LSIAGETNSNALPKRYISVSLIARGGMGEVYRATDSVLQRKVAIKLLSERHAGEEDVRARFRREALAAARLSGTPHVITIFDVGEHRRRPYIVMEYLDGGSVHDRLREGPVPPGQALEWLAQAGVALDRAHAEGVVHRDVKPANLLLDRDGNIVVSDFGIASTTGVDTLTLPGTILGTAGYLSPEQARGEPSTAASDRYGLGVVAFELLTGRRPFEGDTAATEAFAHVNAPVPSARSLYPELPPAVDDVLERALAKDSADRPVSCGELVRDLRDAFALRGVSRPAPTLVAPAARVPAAAASRTQHRAARPRYRTLGFAAAGLIVAGLASGALLSSIGDAGGGEAGNKTSTQRTTTEQTTTEQTTTEQTTTQPPTTQTTVSVSGEELNDTGFALMEAGDFQGALSPLERAVQALSGSGAMPEAWASYNLAYTRFALGRCDGVLELLDRSENIQGERREINKLYREAYKRCVRGGDGDDD
jgi:eukaryotic-like serine/threonine-protein kinase